jgi:uncharacterized Rmd1/YagE family protein
MKLCAGFLTNTMSHHEYFFFLTWGFLVFLGWQPKQKTHNITNLFFKKTLKTPVCLAQHFTSYTNVKFEITLA